MFIEFIESTPLLAAIFLMITLLLLLASGIWVALALLVVGWLGMMLFTGASVGSIMATTSWGATSSWTLTALPLFIWMGDILFRTRLSQELFRGLSPWMSYLPGRLVHTNVVGSAIFAAVSGSSAATAATIGKITLPELRKRGYDEKMSLGSLAGAATLGILIPPSIIFIVYGVSAEISIARLFIAGIMPGILLVCLFMGYIIIWSLFNPEKIPQENFSTLPLKEKLKISMGLLPVTTLIVAVLGSLYLGLATPTESAALGVLGALVISLLSGSLTWETFKESLLGATITSCMIGFILIGADFLTKMMGFTGIPEILAKWIASLGLSHYALLGVLTIFFIMLGCFLDGISMVVLTASVILPIVSQAGIDLIWFGVYVVIVVEIAQITPPVGFNLFVLQGLTGRDIFYITRAAFPFFLVLLLAALLITIFPQIVTWLPTQMSIRQ